MAPVSFHAVLPVDLRFEPVVALEQAVSVRAPVGHCPVAKAHIERGLARIHVDVHIHGHRLITDDCRRHEIVNISPGKRMVMIRTCSLAPTLN